MSDAYDDDGVTDDEPRQEAPPARPRNRAGSPPPEAEQLLKRVLDTVAGARPMPLSASVMINRDEVVEMLEEAIARLPEELRAARWLLKEREEFLGKVRREGDDILEQARTRAERMVQRTEVVKAADARARQIVDRAEDQARRMRLECEDFCDQKLASFEIVLERTQKMVAAGRTKLQGKPPSSEDVEEQDDDRVIDARPSRSRRPPVFDQEA